MSKMLPQPGTYQARLAAPITLRPEVSGALMAYIPYALTNSQQPHSDIHALCLGSKDGTPQARNIEVLRKIFADWGGNPFDGLIDIQPNEDGAAQFELQDCYHDDSYTKDGDAEPTIRFKAQWLNPLGGSGVGIKPPTPDEWKAAQTKWGSKFKALIGTKPSPKQKAAEESKPASKPQASSGQPSKSASAGPPGRRNTAAQDRTSTQEEVWDALIKANPDVPQDELGERYYAAQDEVKPNANGNLSIQEWGQVADKLGV